MILDIRVILTSIFLSIDKEQFILDKQMYEEVPLISFITLLILFARLEEKHI